MPLLNKREYQKKDPFRDATIFIIVCEGSHKEPEYFKFFHLLTRKIKVIPVPSKDGKSSPVHLIPNAQDAILEHNSDGGDFELWFVIDVDRWRDQIHQLHIEASENKWNIAISNPCFEVWLNDHFEEPNSPESGQENCKSWKVHVHEKYGGFDHTQHQTFLERAIKTSEEKYTEKGYIPDIGKTQLFNLCKKLFELTKTELRKYFQ